MTRASLLTILACIAMLKAPAAAQQVPPPFASAPSEIQVLVRRQMKGERLSPADSAKVDAYARKAAIAGTGVASPEVQRLMAKAMSGKPLSSEERGKLAQAMMAQRTTGSGAASAVDQHVAGMVQRAAAGKAPSSSALDTLRAQGYARGRAAAARAGSAAAACPAITPDGSAFTPLRTTAELVATLRTIVNTYDKKLSAADASRFATFKTDAGGVGLWMIGRIEPAIVVLARAAIASPTAHTLNNLGAALNADRDYVNARIILDAANRFAPGSPALLTNLGVAYAGLGQDSLAERQLRRALAAQPALAQTRIDLATMLKCARGHAPKRIKAATDEAEHAQTDWFSADEDRDVRIMRAEQGLPVSGPAAESEYTPRRPMMMTFGAVAPTGAPGGDVPKPVMPGSVDEFAAMYVAGHYRNESQRLSERAQAWHAAATRLRAAFARRRQQWLAGANGSRVRIPMSHDDALIGLARRRSRMYYDVARSEAMMSQDYAPADQRLSEAWERAMRESGGHPCPVIGPAARDAYQAARSAASSHANRVDKIMQDYAEDARQWIGAMIDPQLIAASLNDVAGDADLAGALLESAAARVGSGAMLSWVLTCGPKNGQEVAAKVDPPAVKTADRCPLPSTPSIPLGIVSLVLGCDGIEFTADAGVAIEGKYSRTTRSGAVFVGGGLTVPTGWDDPVTTLGQGATKAAGMASAGGKAGMLFKFDQGGLADAGFEFAFGGSDGRNEKSYAVDLTIVGGLQLSPDLQQSLDALDSKMWDPPPMPAIAK